MRHRPPRAAASRVERHRLVLGALGAGVEVGVAAPDLRLGRRVRHVQPAHRPAPPSRRAPAGRTAPTPLLRRRHRRDRPAQAAQALRLDRRRVAATSAESRAGVGRRRGAARRDGGAGTGATAGGAGGRRRGATARRLRRQRRAGQPGGDRRRRRVSGARGGSAITDVAAGRAGAGCVSSARRRGSAAARLASRAASGSRGRAPWRWRVGASPRARSGAASPRGWSRLGGRSAAAALDRQRGAGCGRGGVRLAPPPEHDRRRRAPRQSQPRRRGPAPARGGAGRRRPVSSRPSSARSRRSAWLMASSTCITSVGRLRPVGRALGEALRHQAREHRRNGGPAPLDRLRHLDHVRGQHRRGDRPLNGGRPASIS